MIDPTNLIQILRINGLNEKSSAVDVEKILVDLKYSLDDINHSREILKSHGWLTGAPAENITVVSPSKLSGVTVMPTAPTVPIVPVANPVVSGPSKSSNAGALVVVIIAILVVAAAGYVYFEKLGPFKLASSTSVVVNDNSIATTSVATTTEDLWAVFDKETLALKNNDLAEFNKYSYKQVPAQAASQFSQFAPMMYQQNAKVNKNDYVNKWQDEKQAIYSTNPQKNNTTDSYGYNVGVVTFVKTNGSWEVLSSGVGYFGETAITAVGEPNRTQAQADKDLQAMMLDSDKDGLTDQEELCLGASQYDKTCVKTDPNNKDSNGNGWWDGIEAKMK